MEREHLLADSGAALMLVPGDLAAGDSEAPLPVPTVPVGLAERPSTAQFREPAGGDAALVLYTSGTTGPPKGVVISRDAIAADLDALADAWAWTADDTLVHGLPLHHVHGLVLGVLGALRTGSRLVHTRRPSPAARGTLYFGGADGVGAGVPRPRLRPRAGFGAAAGLRQRTPAGAGVRDAAGADRAPAGRAVRHDGNLDHRERAG